MSSPVRAREQRAVAAHPLHVRRRLGVAVLDRPREQVDGLALAEPRARARRRSAPIASVTATRSGRPLDTPAARQRWAPPRMAARTSSSSAASSRNAVAGAARAQRRAGLRGRRPRPGRAPRSRPPGAASRSRSSSCPSTLISSNAGPGLSAPAGPQTTIRVRSPPAQEDSPEQNLTLHDARSAKNHLRFTGRIGCRHGAPATGPRRAFPAGAHGRERADRARDPALPRARATCSRATGSAPSRSSPPSSASAARRCARGCGCSPSSHLIRVGRGRAGGIFVARTPNEGMSRNVSESIATMLATESVSLSRAARRAAVPRGAAGRARRAPTRPRRPRQRLQAAIDEAAGHEPGTRAVQRRRRALPPDPRRGRRQPAAARVHRLDPRGAAAAA